MIFKWIVRLLLQIILPVCFHLSMMCCFIAFNIAFCICWIVGTNQNRLVEVNKPAVSLAVRYWIIYRKLAVHCLRGLFLLCSEYEGVLQKPSESFASLEFDPVFKNFATKFSPSQVRFSSPAFADFWRFVFRFSGGKVGFLCKLSLVLWQKHEILNTGPADRVIMFSCCQWWLMICLKTHHSSQHYWLINQSIIIQSINKIL